MSFQAMTWAVGHKCPSAGQKLVLLMLANYCNSHTGQCNPSHQRLAEECCMGVSTLKNHLLGLEEAGLIRIERLMKDGVNLPNQYWLNLGGVGQNLAGGGSESDRGVGQILATNQEVKPVIEPKSAQAADAAHATRARKSPITMKAWLANCEQNQEEPIAEDDPIFADSDKTRLPVEFILLTWLEFRDRYKTGDKANERYADWRATFRNCVRGNWYKLWALDANGEYFLTTNGKMALRRHEQEMAA